jgi:predicted permease
MSQKMSRPPRWPEWLLGRLLPATRASEAVLGDLAEDFAQRVTVHGRARAVVWYGWQCVVIGRAAALANLRDKGRVEMRSTLEDVRYALRTLRRSPGFAATVVLTLGLGIGANSAIYSLVHATLIQALPYEGGDDRLVQLRQPSETQGVEDMGFSALEIEDYRSHSTTLEEVAEHHQLQFNLIGAVEPLRIFAGVVSANFFATLGVQPLHGRLFTNDDDRADAPPVMILTYEFWMDRMGGDPAVIGTSLEMNERIHAVVGVLPPVPLYPGAADLYIPTSACPFRSGARWTGDRTMRAMSLFGRLSDAADRERLNAELATVSSALHAEHPADYPPEGRLSTRAVALREALVEGSRSTFLILLAAAGLVLLIAVANVANLTFARLVRMERALAVRSALGASRSRIARLVLSEAIVLGLLGGLFGLLLATFAMDLLVDFAARYTPRGQEVTIDASVFGFTAIIAIGAGLLAGLLPLFAGMGGVGCGGRVGWGAPSEDRRRRQLRRGLVASQVGVSFVVLLAAGLTLRSLRSLHAVDPGFSTEQVLTMEIPAPFRRPPMESQRFYTDLLLEVRALPGVSSAAAVMTFPLDGWGQMATPIQIEGLASAPGEAPPRADLRLVTTDYFETMGISIVEGRTFSGEDELTGSSVAIVNQALARRAFAGSDPLGRRVSWDGGGTWLTIVGVAGDVRHYGMRAPVESELYQPSSMMMNSLLVRADSDPASLLAPITRIVRDLDPGQPVANVATMGDRRAESLAPARLITTLLAFFGALAVFMTAAGIGGMIAFDVSQRTREIGIRLALGSSRTEVVALLLRQSMLLTAVGLAFGVVASRGLGRFVESLLYDVEAGDPITTVAVALAVAVVALAATMVPVRRAIRIDPRESLAQD